jgi:hypothetical protein
MNWNKCAHDWQISTRDFDCAEGKEEVICTKCNCPGERDRASGEVFWPAT